MLPKGVLVLAFVVLLVLSAHMAASATAPVQDQEIKLSSIELSGHEGSVSALAWSPDSAILASSAASWDSQDNAIRLWQSDGSLLVALQGHQAPAASLDWSPDGRTLASGSYDQTIRLWDRDGTLRQTIEVNRGVVFTVDWSPDGQHLLVASLIGPTDNHIQVWSIDGTLRHDLRTDYSGGKFLHAAWSPDGAYFAGGATDYWLWRADGTHVFTREACAQCTPTWGFAWSPDSQRWAIGNESGNVWVFDTEGAQLGQMSNPQGNVDVLKWSPDGEILAGTNTLWHLEESGFKARATLGTGRLWGLEWSPQGHLIASANTNQHIIHLWDRAGAEVARLHGHDGVIEALAWSPDGALLASGSTDQHIRLWDMSEL
jgi:WD40 repeat protein